MNHPRDYMGYVTYLTQEILMDASTPGKVAADRLVSNARLLNDTVQSWASYYGWTCEEMMKEVWKHDQEAERRQLDRVKKATGRRTRN